MSSGNYGEGGRDWGSQSSDPWGQDDWGQSDAPADHQGGQYGDQGAQGGAQGGQYGETRYGDQYGDQGQAGGYGAPAGQPGQPGQPGQAWQQPTQEWTGAPPQGAQQAPPQHGQQGWGQQQPPGQNWGGGWNAGPQQAPPQQQPPGPPQGQPGWGPPAAQPYQQQQWGGPQPYGAPPKKKSSPLPWILGGGGVLVLIIVIIVIVAVVSSSSSGGGGGGGGGGGLGSSDRKVAWKVEEPTAEAAATFAGGYVSNGVVVRVSGSGVSGYDLAGGKSKFNVTVPAGSAVCASAPAAVDGVAAIVYGPKGRCTTAAGIDIATGKQLWKSSPKLKDSTFPPFRGAIVGAGDKFVMSIGEQVVAYDAKSQEKNDADGIWARTAKDGCTIGDVSATDKAAYVIAGCSSESQQMASYDFASGKELFRVSLGVEDTDDPQFVSGSPTVLHIDNASDNGELRVYDAKGKLTQTIQSRGDGGALDLDKVRTGYSDSHAIYPVTIVGTTLVAITADDTSSTTAHTKAVGVNLSTGARSWIKDLGSDNDYVMARGDDASKVSVVDTGDYDTNPQLDTIDPKTGSVTRGDTLDKGEDSFYSFTTTMVTSGDTAIRFKTSTSGDDPIITAYK